MIILGIETSCDETAAAVLKQNNHSTLQQVQDRTEQSGSAINSGQARIQILSNVVASSASLQAKYGGVIPEQAAREQLKSIIPVIEESLQVAGLRLRGRSDSRSYRPQDLDAIAVTYGPGLIGSLLVGVETAKTLSLIWQKPLIPVNHLIGHFYANWIGSNPPSFPCIGLLVSGGHTDLVLFENHGKYRYLGGTRDDAAGECFDKCARLLGLPYPGGPQVSKLAQKGDPKAFKLPRPMVDSKDYDFSFSGLKTAVAKLVSELGTRNLELGNFNSSSSNLAPNSISDLAASLEQAIVDVLIEKTVSAAQEYKVDQIIVAGGVAANEKLVSELRTRSEEQGIKLHVPPPQLCTDNAAMIAAAAFFLPVRQAGQKPIQNPLSIQADPGLSLN